MTKLPLCCLLSASLASCAGTRAERRALQDLQPLPLPQAAPALPHTPSVPLSIAARQLDALINLQPLR